MRTAGAAVAAALLSVPLTGPADAGAGVLVADCTVVYDWFSTGTATCNLTGVANGTIHVNAAAVMSFDVENRCPAQSASGVIGGPVSMSFTWTRIGTEAVITTAGDINGGGTGTFSTPCPAIGETLVFEIAGT